MAYYIQPSLGVGRVGANTTATATTNNVPIAMAGSGPVMVCTSCGSYQCSATCYTAHYREYNCHVWWCPNRPPVPGLSLPTTDTVNLSPLNSVTPPAPWLPVPGPSTARRPGVANGENHLIQTERTNATEQLNNTSSSASRTARASEAHPAQHDHDNQAESDWTANWRRGFEVGVGMGAGMGLMMVLAMASSVPGGTVIDGWDSDGTSVDIGAAHGNSNGNRTRRRDGHGASSEQHHGGYPSDYGPDRARSRSDADSLFERSGDEYGEDRAQAQARARHRDRGYGAIPRGGGRAATVEDDPDPVGGAGQEAEMTRDGGESAGSGVANSNAGAAASL